MKKEQSIKFYYNVFLSLCATRTFIQKSDNKDNYIFLFYFEDFLLILVCCSYFQEEKVQMGRSHGEEMEEVDHYVEHIKQLSAERDDVLQSLELENRQLKEQVMQLTDDPNASRFINLQL